MGPRPHQLSFTRTVGLAFICLFSIWSLPMTRVPLQREEVGGQPCTDISLAQTKLQRIRLPKDNGTLNLPTTTRILLRPLFGPAPPSFSANRGTSSSYRLLVN
jgi:hypothetical protein